MGLGLRQKWRKFQQKNQFKKDFASYKKSLETNGYKSKITEPKAVAILLSYARPENIEWIAKALLQCDFVEKVIISNNNPDMKMEDYISFSDARMEIQNQTERRRAGYRYEIAKHLDAENYIFIDDDLFLTCEQIEAVYAKLLEKPEVAHGIWGQIISEDADGNFSIQNGVRQLNKPIDVINRAYFLTRAHVERFLKILQLIDIHEVINLKFGDDMILSACGTGKPHCHDIGGILECHTTNMEGIAIWTDNTFADYRVDLYKKLLSLPE